VVDTELYVHDVSGSLGCYLIRRWGHVEVYGVIAYDQPVPASELPLVSFRTSTRSQSDLSALTEIARSACPFCIQFTDGEDPYGLPLEEFLGQWILHLTVRYARTYRVKTDGPQRDRTALVDRLQAWVAEGRALEDQLFDIVGEELTMRLASVVEQISAVTEWAQTRFHPAPRDRRGLADLYFSTHLWAWDRFRAAAGMSREAALVGQGGIMRPMLEVLDEFDHKSMTYEALQQKILRLEARIKPGQAEFIMADVLETIRRSPVDSRTSDLRLCPIVPFKVTRTAK
jgi:hypothetical protein